MTEIKQRVQQLLRFVLAVEESKLSAPRQVPSEFFAVQQAELKGMDGVHFNMRSGDQDLWLKIDRLEETPPPSVKTTLQAWIQVSKSPLKEPILSGSITVPMADGKISVRTLDQAPEVRELFNEYLVQRWRPWSENETRRRRSIALYRKLFMLQQAIANEASDQPLELIWGVALAVWSPPDGSASITHPLITQTCEIGINSKNYSIEIRPDTARPKLESACFVELGLAGVRALESYWQALRDTDGDAITPFEESSFSEVARLAVSHLDPDGRFESRVDDLSVPSPTPRLTITSTWTLFARKRSGDLIIDDVKALMKHVEKLQDVPSLVKRFVQQSTGPVDFAPPRHYRGLSSISHAKEAAELFFPLPYNQEQVTIAEKLDHADGVVVQGPPGTGKSHSIANIICHFLAQGKRVLVTAKSESALAVIQQKLPEKIRPLTVALLSTESAGNRQFESNVRTIDAELSRISPERAYEQISLLQAEIDQTHNSIEEIDRRVARLARVNLQPVKLAGVEVSPAEVARRVIEDAPAFKWFDDMPTTDADVGLDESTLDSLRQARRKVGLDIKYLQEIQPSADSLPTSDELTQTHRDIARAKQLSQAQHRGEVLPLKDSSNETLAALQHLARSLEQRNAAESTTSTHGWGGTLISELRRARSNDPVVQTLRNLTAEIAAAEILRRAHVAQAIDVPEGAEKDPELRIAVARCVQGSRPFLLPFGHAEQRATLAAIRIAGISVGAPEQWKLVESVLAWRDSTQRMLAQWDSLAVELRIGSPGRDATAAAFRALVSMATTAHAAMTLVLETEPRVQLLAHQVFGDNRAVRAENFVHSLPEIELSVRAHLENGALGYALQRRNEYLDQLRGKVGEVTNLLADFLNEKCGSELEEGTFRSEWIAIQEELIRRNNLGSAFRTIHSVTEVIERSGAPKWANRLRTLPADPSTDLDPLVPSNWREAWLWRRRATFVERIDAHAELRKCFEERHQLTSALARAYQAIAAQKTWLAVALKAGPDVRGALKAYLSAILNMGKGTGKNAVMLRRDAKRAMSSAYVGVPCWILPHWRVSEALPATIGLFDLVIVDEASQSDLSSLPAILRGKKLLVVGDDKQVSPSAIGVPIETLRDLRNRFLDAFPENVGPLLLPGRSLYELASVIFAGHDVMLREHFRSVAPIINWSNAAYYDNKIVPLRVPTGAERLDPPLVDVHVVDGKRERETNPLEAQAVVDEILSICGNAELKGRSIGVVTLLGTEQAHLINGLVANQVSQREIIDRDIAIGPPPLFQGRERDIILISMVIDANSRGAADKPEIHQRFNVAMSRARDRMVIFRSLTEDNVSPTSLSAKVLAYFREPQVTESQASAEARDRCESNFEREIYDELVLRGYRVTPQVKAGPYRIDLVVEDVSGRRLAIECDGDRFHGPDRWGEDMFRQRVLERAGWTFWRCFASTWVRRRSETIDDLLGEIGRLKIQPAAPTDTPRLSESRIYVPRRSDNEEEDVESSVVPQTLGENGLSNENGGSTIRAESAGTMFGSSVAIPDPSLEESLSPLDEAVTQLMLSLIPIDGSSIGNLALRKLMSDAGQPLSDDRYFSLRASLIRLRAIETGKGRGGSVKRTGQS